MPQACYTPGETEHGTRPGGRGPRGVPVWVRRTGGGMYAYTEGLSPIAILSVCLSVCLLVRHILNCHNSNRNQAHTFPPNFQTRPTHAFRPHAALRLHTHTHPPNRLAHPRSPIPPLSTLTSRATHAHPTSPRRTRFCAIWDCASSSSGDTPNTCVPPQTLTLRC